MSNEDLVDQVFAPRPFPVLPPGHWSVLYFSGMKKYHAMWRCRCRCGTEADVRQDNLVKGTSTQCRRCAARKVKHGQSVGKKTPEYVCWHALRRRRAGVCPRWQGVRGFQTFFSDMGPKPRPKNRYHLSRKDLSQPFSSENCVWKKYAVRREKYLLEGQAYTVGELAFIADKPRSTILSRIRSGLDPADAVACETEKRRRTPKTGTGEG